MHPAYIIQPLFAVLSIVVTCVALSKWRQPRLLFFTCLTILISLINIGYLLEITAPSLDAAILATKLQQLGTPFIGVLYLLFSLDYCNSSLPNNRLIPLLFVIPCVVALSAFTWPIQNWYYTDIAFIDAGGLRHLEFDEGIFYYINFSYNLCVCAVSAIFISNYYKTAGRHGRRHAMVVLIALLLPAFAQVLRLLRIPFSHWNLIPAFLTLSGVGLVWYIASYRQREWQTLGRELVVENMKDAFILLDTRDRYMDANAAAFRYFPQLQHLRTGVRATTVNGFPPQLISQDDGVFTVNVEGEELYLRTSRSHLLDGERVLGTGILVYDDTENQRLMDELQQMATHDALTGLYNRGTFFSYAGRDYALTARRRDAASVLMIDIDHFKRVNDQYGHATGDTVIAAVAQVLQARLRHTDICGRYGGEELAVWLPGAHAEGAALIADVIRRAVQHTTFEADEGRFNVTVSIGVSSINHEENQSFEDLVNQADTALYQAKNSGRNRVCTYQQA